MTVTIYGIKNCDTMKKAFALLDKRGIDYAFHDYKKEGVPGARLSAWASEFGWEKIVNTRGPTFRKIPETERTDLNQARALKLLAQYSSAIKRPIVESGKKVIIGFDPDEFAKLK